MITRTNKEPRQLPLLPLGDLGPPDDPVGVALGIAYDDPDAVWPDVMGLFSGMAIRAYHNAKAASESEPQY